MTIQNPIILALDVPSAEQALHLVKLLHPVVGAFKVGKELYVSAGPDIVRSIRATGANVFLDLKFHDIPNTVAKAIDASTRLDVQMLTIHACGGSSMMKAAEEAAQNTARSLNRPPPLILGVTVLTSMDASQFSELGIHGSIESQVGRLANLAVTAGLRGLVCSPLEIDLLRKQIPDHIQLITPGIRPATSELGDQKRVMTPADALRAGATWLVIGRPIYDSSDPVAAAKSILKSLSL